MAEHRSPKPAVAGSTPVSPASAGGDIRRRLSKIKHTINNQLMGLMGHAELVATSGESSSVRDHAKAILEQARRIQDEVQRLDAVARPAPADSAD